MNTLKVHFLLVILIIVHCNLSNASSYSLEDHSINSRPWYLPDLDQLGTSRSYSDSIDDSSSDSQARFTAGTKAVPREDKNFKKPVYPYHTKPEQFRTLFKPGSPYCQEIKNERTRDGSLSCYKCKDPKTGINYKHCSKSRNSRTRRSHPDSRKDEKHQDYTLPADYRFSEEYFLPQASKPASYKDEGDKCERVVKDSMVCMVCKNARTNGKYKQCSYVHDPKDKAYEYSKSSSFTRPAASKTAPVQVNRDSQRDASGESSDSEEGSWEKEHARDYGESNEKSYSSPKAAESSGCKKVHKDGQVCTVCKNPKIGGNSEKCYYEYQPSDKVYKFTRSKSFGYPYAKYDKKDSEESVEESESSPKESSAKDEPSSFYKDFSYGGGSYEQDEPFKFSESKSEYDFNPIASVYDSESEKIAEESKSADCKEVRKDSMVCSVCKDPKTGGNSERCTYSYNPSDKVFSYTKKKSFGSPTEFKERADYGSDEDVKELDENRPQATDDSIKYSETKLKDVKEKNNYTEPTTEWDSKSDARASKVDLGYLDTSKRKAEIDKFLEQFQAEDRTRCEKIMRNRMTCYRCADEEGFRKEECMYVTEPGVGERPKKKVKREPAKRELLEPVASASEDRYTRVRRAEGSQPEEAPRDHHDHQDDEADAYDTAAETVYRYDKVLGFSLPAYMLDTSEQEAEFDEIVAAGY